MTFDQVYRLVSLVVPPMYVRVTPMYLAGLLIVIGLVGEALSWCRDSR